MRPARPHDAPAIARVHVDTWRVAYAHVFPEERLRGISVEARADRWRDVLAQPREGEYTAVAEVEDEIVGFASAGPDRDPTGAAELRAIYVHPEFWGSGAGHALLSDAVAWLHEAGYETAILWVLEDNPRARRFYEREGWDADGATKVERVLDTDAPHVRYRIGLVDGAAAE